MKNEIFSSVISNKEIAKDIYIIKLNTQRGLDFVPGQFANVQINRADLLLRRPISIHRYSSDSGEMTLIYKVVGKGTKEMSELTQADEVSILAPLGKGFLIEESYKNIFLIGGGIGCAPLMSIIDNDGDKSYTTFLGFDREQSIYCKQEFDDKSGELIITTDDGSYGVDGFITQQLANTLKSQTPDVIFACGPTPMLKSLKAVVKDYDIPTFVSVEERMGCGMGGCAVCACKTVNGVKKACVDGPVFDINEVIL